MEKVNVKITAVHFNPDWRLEEFIENKISKLRVFNEDISEAEVNLSLERSNSKNYNSKVVKIKIFDRKNEYFAEKKDATFEKATDMAVDALKTQILRAKGKK